MMNKLILNFIKSNCIFISIIILTIPTPLFSALKIESQTFSIMNPEILNNTRFKIHLGGFRLFKKISVELTEEGDSGFSLHEDLILKTISTELLTKGPLNYPNPFQVESGTEINYILSKDVDINLTIYSITGHLIFENNLNAGIDDGAIQGYNTIKLSTTELGIELPSGLYLYILKNENKVLGKEIMAVIP